MMTSADGSPRAPLRRTSCIPAFSRRGSDPSHSASPVRSSEFYRRLSLGILSNSPTTKESHTESASYLRHLSDEKKCMSSLGRASKDVASSFSSIKQTSGKSRDSLPTNQLSDYAMLKKCPYFRFGPRLSNKRLSAWKLKEKNLQKFLRLNSVPPRDLTIQKWIPQGAYSDSSSDEEEPTPKTLPKRSGQTIPLVRRSAGVSLVQEHLSRRRSAPPGQRSAPTLSQRASITADNIRVKTAANIVRNITKSYIEEAVKPIPHLPRPKRSNITLQELDCGTYKQRSTKHSGSVSQGTAISRHSSYSPTSHKDYAEPQSQRYRAKSAVVVRHQNSSLKPSRPLSAGETTIGLTRRRSIRPRSSSAGINIQFRCLEQINEDNNQHMMSRQRMSGSQNHEELDKVTDTITESDHPSILTDSNGKRPKSAKRVDFSAVQSVEETTSPMTDSADIALTPEDDQSPAERIVRPRPSFYQIVRSAMEKEKLQRDAHKILMDGDYNTLPQWKRELLQDAPQISSSDEGSKVNMTMSHSARRKELNRLIHENETDKKQLIRIERNRREKNKWALILSVLALNKVGDGKESPIKKVSSATIDQRLKSSSEIHPSSKTDPVNSNRSFT